MKKFARHVDKNVFLADVSSVRRRFSQSLKSIRSAPLSIDFSLNLGGGVLRTLPCRVLVLQGERDYQVTMKDFERWQGALAGRGRAMLKTYPPLNHLLVSGSGPSTSAEYMPPRHVDEGVVRDIAEWLLQAKAK